MNRFDYPNGDPESYAYDDEEQHYHEVLKELDELDKQGIPAGIDVDECDEDEDEGCMEAKQAAATKEKEAGKNVAMRKARFTYTFQIHKTDQPRVIKGVIFPGCDPGVFCPADQQGDVVNKTDLRNAAWSFLEKLANGSARVSRDHGSPAQASVVESHIAEVPFQLENEYVPAGSWVGAVRVNSDSLWKQIENGDVAAFSLGGTALRVPNFNQVVEKSAAKPVTQLRQLEVDEWALVKRGANGRRFSIVRKTDFENNMENDIMNETDNEIKKNEETNPDFELAEFEKMAVEIKKSNPGLSDEQAYTSAVHLQPDLYARYLEKLMNLQKAAQEPEFPIQKESDLPPEVANSIVILKEFVEKMGQSSNPELQGYSEVTAEILRKSAEDGIEKSEPEAFSEAVYAIEQQAPGTYANYLSRISQLHM